MKREVESTLPPDNATVLETVCVTVVPDVEALPVISEVLEHPDSVSREQALRVRIVVVIWLSFLFAFFVFHFSISTKWN